MMGGFQSPTQRLMRQKAAVAWRSMALRSHQTPPHPHPLGSNLSSHEGQSHNTIPASKPEAGGGGGIGGAGADHNRGQKLGISDVKNYATNTTTTTSMTSNEGNGTAATGSSLKYQPTHTHDKSAAAAVAAAISSSRGASGSMPSAPSMMMIDLEKQQQQQTRPPFFISEKALLAGREAGLVMNRGLLNMREGIGMGMGGPEAAAAGPSATSAAAAWHSHPLTVRRVIVIVGMICVVGTLSVVHLIRDS